MQIEDLTATLPRRGEYHRRPLEDVRLVVVHHTAGPDDESPEHIARYHLARGWGGCGYHYVVYRTGRVVKARPVSAIPACVLGWNRESVCIALVGDYRRVRPSGQLLAVAQQLTDALVSVLPVQAVVTHRALGPTVCPGDGTVEAWQTYVRAAGGHGLIDAQDAALHALGRVG
jgi:hypothetical protein